MLRVGAERGHSRTVRDRIVLPAVATQHPVPGLEAVDVRLDDLGDGAADHDLVYRDGGGVGFRSAHPAAHVGVERKVLRAEQHLPVAGFGDGYGLEA